jgi:hypothetical protein
LEEADSRSLDSVITRSKAALLVERSELVGVSKCIRYKEQEWSLDTHMNAEFHKLTKRVLASGVVEIGGSIFMYSAKIIITKFRNWT